MSPSHVLSSRRPTEGERRVMAGLTKPDVGSYGCMFLVIGWIPLAALGVLIAGLAGWLPRPPAYAVWLLVISIVIVGAAVTKFVLGIRSIDRRERRRAAADTEAKTVQVVEVRHPRVIEIGLINENEPNLAMDIGDDMILYLQGQWLRETRTYGAAALTDDPDGWIFNGLPSPHSFPSTGFTVSRLPNSGRVLSIQVSGEYRHPEKEVDALQPEYEFLDSELFGGALDDIAKVLEREHTARSP